MPLQGISSKISRAQPPIILQFMDFWQRGNFSCDKIRWWSFFNSRRIITLEEKWGQMAPLASHSNITFLLGLKLYGSSSDITASWRLLSRWNPSTLKCIKNFYPTCILFSLGILILCKWKEAFGRLSGMSWIRYWNCKAPSHPSPTVVRFLVWTVALTPMGTYFRSRRFRKMHLENILPSPFWARSPGSSWSPWPSGGTLEGI